VKLEFLERWGEWRGSSSMGRKWITGVNVMFSGTTLQISLVIIVKFK